MDESLTQWGDPSGSPKIYTEAINTMSDKTTQNPTTRAEGYYWVRTPFRDMHRIAAWTQTDGGEWRWALTGCSMGLPDASMTPISGPLPAPECNMPDRAMPDNPTTPSSDDFGCAGEDDKDWFSMGTCAGRHWFAIQTNEAKPVYISLDNARQLSVWLNKAISDEQ